MGWMRRPGRGDATSRRDVHAALVAVAPLVAHAALVARFGTSGATPNLAQKNRKTGGWEMVAWLRVPLVQ